MPKYIYTAKGYSGESKGGEMVASNEKALVYQLRSDGYLVTSIKLVEEEENNTKAKFFDRIQTVPLKEKLLFAKNLSVMIASGVTVSKALINLTNQTSNQKFKKILTDVNSEMQSGKSLSDSLAKYPNVFNELFVNMVKVGETGGNLEEILKIISIQLEKEHDLVSKLKGALIYPAVIIVAMIGIGIIMLTFVIPKLMGVFKDMQVELPASTQMIINVSDFMSKNSILTMVLLAAIVVGIKIFIGKESGKRTISYLNIHLPIISNLVIKVNCARFARIYSSLLKSGISVVDALRIISNTLTNRYYRDALTNSIEEIQKGVPLSKIIEKYPRIFPVMVGQIIEVGEETGKTETVLMELATFYEDEVDLITKNFSSVIEPILMIFIGGAVGFFAISMLQPMYSLMDNIK